MILTAGPLISGRETSYALDAVRTGWNHHWADYHKRFDKTFCQKLGRKHALLTASCTGALHLALLGVGIKAGDEVIVPELTWVATASAAVYCGAKPVFVDVQPDTWCMDPQAFKAAITPRTKAVMPVHLYGHPANLKEICAIAKQHNIAVVEDAAAAYGSYVEGKAAGTYGDVACFSFQGAKTLVTGEGGIMLTDDDAIFERANAYAEHGRAVEGGADFWIDKIGFKYKMANTLAAVGLGQLEQAEMIVEAKRRLYEWYKEGLDGVPGVTLLGEAPWAQSAFWMNSIMLSDDIKFAQRLSGH
jgi:perosamine synthetase